MIAKFAVFAAVVALAAASAAFPQDCEVGCSENKDTEGSCLRGCRLHGYAEARHGIKGLFGSEGRKFALEGCNKDCAESFHEDDEENVKACHDGCKLASSAPRRIHDKVFNVFNVPNPRGLLRVYGSEPLDPKESNEHKESKEVDDMLFAPPSFIKQVHEMMRSVMSGSVFGNSDEGEGLMAGMPLRHSGGELVVIKSGPGFHEEKTYHLGPNTNIDKILDDSMNDMMERRNPIEKFGELNDIEVFNPADFLEKTKSDEANNNAVVRANNLFDTDPWGFISGNGVVGGQPRLQETEGGERMFAKPYEVDREARSSSRKFAHWLNGLHTRMGLPNWLMAASVALGVIFTLWLCMVIPSSAPKQKAKRLKMIGTKEAEAELGISTVITSNYVHSKVDLPPSYDDVSKRGALEPVHGLKAKVGLDDDEAEPLPLKKSDDLA